MKIGVFDSGVGGLTVLKKLIEKINFVEYVYCADNLNSPYGIKSVDEIKLLSLKIIDFLIEQKVDMIVIACNTATIACLEYLNKESFGIPIIGIISSGADIVISENKSKKVGVLATPLTIKSNIYKDTINKLDKNIEVYQQECEQLCPLIEKDWKKSAENILILKGYLEKLPKDIDTLLLGCTHYPIIQDDIENIFSGKIIDPADGIVKEVLLNINNMNKERVKEMDIKFYTSGDINKFKEIGENFLKFEIKNIQKVIY